MRAWFNLLTPDEALDLCGYDSALVQPADQGDHAKWLNNFIELLANIRSYESQCRASLTAKQDGRALSLAARAEQKGTRLSDSLEEDPTVLWHSWVADDS